MSAAEVSDPAVAVQLAATAVGKTIYFRWAHKWTVARAREEAPRLLHFARQILAHPAAKWWFAPLERNKQVWLGPTGASPPEPIGQASQASPPTDWERFVQWPTGALLTSTGVGGLTEEPSREISSTEAALMYHSGDYELGTPPLVRYRLHAAPDARIYEVDGPLAWYQLCVRYQARTTQGQLVPDWGQFSRDWDGVHLCLGGLLTADQVRIDGDEGWTELRLWEFEQTRWVRWYFLEEDRMSDLVDLDEAPLAFPKPPSLEPPQSLGRRVLLLPEQEYQIDSLP